MFQIPLMTSSSKVSLEKFWNAVLLYHNRPHLANRRLLGAVNILFLKVDFLNGNIKRLSEIFTRSAILYQVRELKDISKESFTKDFIKNILDTYDKEVHLEATSIENFLKSEDGVYVTLRILLPRQELYESCVEVAILDKNNTIATFLAVTEFDRKTLAPNFPYDIEYVTEGNIRICVQDFENAESNSADWLSDQLFTKLIKWAENYDPNLEIQQSLSLISIEKYTYLYHNLKTKYGERIVKNWTERTDPLKFVYEDIAIAAYLISLWEQTNPQTKPTFVDLGCGNGLLVYILNEEGFPGYGIDVRKRNIWDWYPKSTTLKVQTITPSASSLFPEADWIIGNHSDELTPWIPVIAARSSHKTNFFLLPCCCYEFSGQKYKRTNSSVSIYADYINYIEEVCKTCQFHTQVDKLRIPSTKRTCLVSFGRSYNPEMFLEVNKNITNLIAQRCCEGNTNNKPNEAEEWTRNFQPRSNVEKVKNCTQLDRRLVTNIVGKISQSLLSEKNLLRQSNGNTWNKGGTISLPNLVDVVGKDDLKELKNECGGLQTLLRNHRYIFEVEKGTVRLRVPLTVQVTEGKYKNKACWFYENHPEGCCNDDEICAYKHCN